MDGVVGCRMDCSESTQVVLLLDAYEMTVCTDDHKRTSTLGCG